MCMRLLIFSLLLLVAPLSSRAEEGADTTMSSSQFTRVDRKAFRHKNVWHGLCPSHFVMQNAGNMGVVSAGIGWDYGKHDQWATDVMFGVIPKYSSDRAKATMTLKQNYYPWRWHIDGRWMVEPLSCGIYFNAVFGDEFWTSQPSRYPDGYYDWLSTRFRINVFIGERVTFTLPHNKHKTVKSVSLFYELSTCDLYIRSIFIDNEVKLWDIIGLSLGVKVTVL